MALDEQERSIRERENRKGYEDLFKVKEPIPTLIQVKCQATRAVKEAKNKNKTRRDYKLRELAYEYDKLFRAYVKRKGQEQFHKVEIRKGFKLMKDKRRLLRVISRKLKLKNFEAGRAT